MNTFSLRTKSNRVFICSLGRGRLSFFSIASMYAWVPSSCGMFRYRLDTSIVASRAFGGIGVFSSREISSWVLFSRDGMLGRVDLR